jgi:hypothetical protein
MKTEGSLIAIQPFGGGASTPAARVDLGKSSTNYARKPATQVEQAAVLDVCGKTRSSKLEMVGPCG